MNEKPQQPLEVRQWLKETLDTLPNLSPEVRQKLDEADDKTLGLIRDCKNAFSFQKIAMDEFHLVSLGDYKLRFDFVDKYFQSLRQSQRANANNPIGKARTQVGEVMNPEAK